MVHFSCISILNLLYLVVLLPHQLYSYEAGPSSRKGKATNPPPLEDNYPKLAAHRGDKALLPENTIPAHDQAALHNVDYVEIDLYLTKDRVIVCQHNITLRHETNVSSSPEFEELMVRDGSWGKIPILNDWVIPDFTLAQLRTLRLNQEQKGVRPQHFNGLFGIPTLQEYIDLVHKDTWRRRKFNPDDKFVMGMMVELKLPDYHNTKFRSDNVMEVALLEELRVNGYLDDPPSCQYNGDAIPCSELIVQSFYVPTIKYLRANSNLTLMALLSKKDPKSLTRKEIREFRHIANYLGLKKDILCSDLTDNITIPGDDEEYDYDGDDEDFWAERIPHTQEELTDLGGIIQDPHDMVQYIHKNGMKVGVYTIFHSYEESKRSCAKRWRKDSKENELKHFFDLDVDLVFVEGLSESLRIRDEWLRNRGKPGGSKPGGTSGGVGSEGSGNASSCIGDSGNASPGNGGGANESPSPGNGTSGNVAPSNGTSANGNAGNQGSNNGSSGVGGWVEGTTLMVSKPTVGVPAIGN